MKKKVIKKIVPAYEMTHTTYQCEGCGAELEFEGSIRECEICGKEICPNCRKVIRYTNETLSYTPQSDGYLSLSSDEDDYVDNSMKVCTDCYEKLIAKSNVYEKCVQHFVDEFNENLNKLNDKYMKGEL